MREYETVICVRTDIDEAQQEKEVQNVQDIIAAKGGEVVLVDPWGRRRLAYEVNKHHEGVYTLVRFLGGSDVLKELERRFRINENLLRYLTVVADTPRPEPTSEEEGEAEGGAAESGEPAAAGRSSAGEGSEG